MNTGPSLKRRPHKIRNGTIDGTVLMNWKATAAVSGATILAGWLAAAPPEQATSSAVSARPSPSPDVPAAASDIQEQATRLQARLRPEGDYHNPERNLFRFGPKGRAESAATSYAPPAAAPAPEEVPSAPPLPPPIPVRLSGVASDQIGDRTERTAILSSPAGVLLVREGDEVLGLYKVARVGDDAVELLRLADGVTVRVALRP